MPVDPATRLLSLADQIAPRFRREFESLVRKLRDASSLPQLETLLASGRIEEALLALEQAAVGIGGIWGRSYVAAGDSTATFLGNTLETVVNFDQVNTRAVQVMQRNQLRLVREFTTQQRQATREALVNGVTRGLNPRDQARAFRQSIGLTQRQVRAVNNYRAALERGSLDALSRKLRDKRFDRTVQRAVREGRALTTDQIDKMVGRYEQRWIKFRSETIARTEALESAHAGSHEMYKQAVDNGTLDRDSLIREWDDSDDARVRDFPKAQTSHRTMDGQTRRLDEPFTSGAGNMLMYPADSSAPAVDRVLCRCAVTTRFNKGARLEGAAMAATA